MSALGKKTIKNLEKYLEARLQINILLRLIKTKEMKVGEFRHELETQELCPQNIGLFQHALKTVVLGLTVWEDLNKNKYQVKISLYYRHHSGGTNGSELNFSLEGSCCDDNIIEISDTTKKF